MRGLRIVVLCAAMFGLLVTGARAQDDPGQAARLDIARQILAARTTEAGEAALFNAKLPYFVASIASQTQLTDAQRAALPAMLQSAYHDARAPAREQVATTYARLFTLEQLQELLAFYHSDVGQAFLAHQDELTTEGISLQRLVDAAVLSLVTRQLREGRGAQGQ